MFKNIRERKLHLFIFTFLLGLFLGVHLSVKLSAQVPAYTYLDYFHQVYQLISAEYVDEIAPKDVFYGAISGMIKSLKDPFSRFLDEEAFSELKEETTGKFVGVGVEITTRNGEIIVISPIDDTPAMRAGIKAGDIISKINETRIKDKSLSEIIKLIRGIPNTKVTLTIIREGFEDPLTFEIERAPIRVETVSYDVIKEKGSEVGYIRVKVFSSDTTREIEKALADFNKRGVKRLVVDLRWNPGGLLDKAITISELFLDKGKTIVSTRGREGSGNEKSYKSQREPLYKGGVVLLVNKGSASASEILAAAIRDNSRGVLVGEKTFGKGSVQKFYNLNDNTGVSLTIAKYYTPSGISIHGKGIVPDTIVEAYDFPEAEKKTINRILKDKLVESFIKNHGEYNEKTRKAFVAFLGEQGLGVSTVSANYLLKSEIFRYVKKPLYDLEFDTQLRKALEIANAGK
ncbi:MAG TPA: S41 family peptidase [Spirochaetes bacterium]|nr:S41 family peptidase [Spirochaetota bacterium]